MTYELTGQIEELLGQRVRGNGVNGSFLCPFHEERTASFSIHLDEGLWYCFGCGRKGNLARLYKELGQELTEEQRQDLLIKSVFREPEEKKNFARLANQHRRTFERGTGRTDWLAFISSRPIAPRAESYFGVGFSEETWALAFPYWNDDGTVTAIRYRRRDGSKYFEDGSQRSLYNGTNIIGAPTILIAEGESDAMAAWSRASDDLAICGSPGAGVSERTWSNWALDFLFARRIYVAFDSDGPGDAGAEVAMRVLGVERCRRARPTRGTDLSEHIAEGGTLVELGVAEANDDV